MAAIIPVQTALAPEIADANAHGARHVCLDIETMDASKKDIALVMEFWKPPGNINNPDVMRRKKDETRAAFKKRQQAARELVTWKLQEEAERLKRQAALLDAAPIAMICIVTEASGLLIYWPKPKDDFSSVRGSPARVVRVKNERALLLATRDWMDKIALPKTVVIGFNILSFDAPKLRCAFVRHRLTLPKLIHPDARQIGVETYDVMQRFRNFSSEHSDDRHVSLDEVQARFALARYKGKIAGKDVPAMLRDGLVREVGIKCLLDTTSTYHAFLAMTGHTRDQEAPADVDL